MRETRKIHFTDYVISQGDSPESPERVGVLESSTVSETATWSVNDGKPWTFTWPELDALAEAATAQYLGELKDLLREARAVIDLGPADRARSHRLRDRLDKTLADPAMRVPPGKVLGPDGRFPGKVITSRHVACPECGVVAGHIDHLIADAEKRAVQVTAGPWFCDQCGCGFDLLVRPDGSVSLAKTKERTVRVAVLLRLRDHGAFHVVVHDFSTNYLSDPTSPEAKEAERYLYEQHHCPENILRVAHVIANGETDAHGLFELVAVRTGPDVHDETDRVLSADEIFTLFGVKLEIKHDD